MTDVPETSPERPIIWSQGCPTTGPRRPPVDVPSQNFCIFVFPVKSSNRCIKKELLHLKNTFFIKLSILLLFHKSPLKVPWRSRTLGLLGGLEGMSPGRHVPAGKTVIRRRRRFNTFIRHSFRFPFRNVFSIGKYFNISMYRLKY